MYLYSKNYGVQSEEPLVSGEYFFKEKKIMEQPGT
jgi:hypothetical protein